MKKIFLILLAITLMSAVASAAPLTDFNLGHASLDANIDLNIASNSDLKLRSDGDRNGVAFGSDFAATFGLIQGQFGGFAIQTKYANYAGPSVSGDVTNPITGKAQSASSWISAEKQEYNIIYQVPFDIPVKIQPYIGLDFVNVGLGSKNSDTGNRGYGYQSSYGFHGGVGVIMPFAANQWNVFGNISGGNTFFDVGAGISYSPVKVLDVNLGLKYDCFFANGKSLDGKEGASTHFVSPYVGVTLKF